MEDDLSQQILHGAFCLECQTVVGVFWNGTNWANEGTRSEKPSLIFSFQPVSTGTVGSLHHMWKQQAMKHQGILQVSRKQQLWQHVVHPMI